MLRQLLQSKGQVSTLVSPTTKKEAFGRSLQMLEAHIIGIIVLIYFLGVAEGHF